MFVFYQIRNKNYFGVVSLLFLTYMGMFVASFLLLLHEDYQGVYPFSLEAMIYFSVSLAIMFVGFMGFKDNKIVVIRIENLFFFRLLETCLIVGGFAAIFFYAPFALWGLTGNIASNRELMKIAQLQILGRFGLLNSVFSLFSKLFILMQLCAFINLISFNGKRCVKRAVLLILSSLSYVVQTLAYVGRDGPVFWIMTFVFCFAFFRKFLTEKESKKIKKWAIIISSVLLVPFFLITMSRFGQEMNRMVWSSVNYYGQQVHNFSDTYLIEAPISYGRVIFPVFLTFFDKIRLSYSPLLYERDYYFWYYFNYDVAPWVFGTYIMSFLNNMGKIATLGFLVVISVSTRLSIRKSRRLGILDFSNLILFSLLYQISYWGVFYFRHYSLNWYIIAMLLLALFFKLSKYPGQIANYVNRSQS